MAAWKRFATMLFMCLAALGFVAQTPFFAMRAYGVEISDAPAAKPVAASPDTALAGRLPGAVRYGDAYCARVAGNIEDTTAICGETAAVLAAAASTDIEPGEVDEALRPDGTAVSYAQAFSEAAAAGEPIAFWAGGTPEGADYVLYVPAGSADAGYSDFRLVTAIGGDGQRGGFGDQLGRDDFLGFSFNDPGALPEGSELYLRVSKLFGNGVYVDVYEPDAEGALAAYAASVPVEEGYVRLLPASAGTYVLVNASGETAAAAVTDTWFDKIQIQPGSSGAVVPMRAVATLVVGIVLVVAVIVVVVRSTRRAVPDGAGAQALQDQAAEQAPARAGEQAPAQAAPKAKRAGKRGGLS